MNKYFKKLFSVFLLLAVGTVGVLITTQNVDAATVGELRLIHDDQSIFKDPIKDGYTLLVEEGNGNFDFEMSGGSIFEFIQFPEGQSVVVEITSGYGLNLDVYGDQLNEIVIQNGATILFDVVDSGNYMLEINGTKFENIEVPYGVSVTFNLIKLPFEDNKRPAISGEEFFVTNVDDKKPLSFFQNYLSAYDETDGDLTDEIYVKTDNYTQNINVLGDHKVVWGVKDYSGNEAILEAFIAVRDITKPVITGTTAVVRIGYKETYNIEAFRASLKVTDNHSSLTNADIKIKTDGYTSNKAKLGTYDIVFNAKDDSDNEGIFTKKIQVYDNIVPEFSGPTVISTSNATVLTESDVRGQLTAHDEIDGTITSRIKLIEDNYTGKGNKVGEYTIKYEVSDNEGNTAYHVVTISRLDKLPPVIWIEDGITIKTTITTPLTFEQIINILQVTGQVQNNSTTNFTKIIDEYEGNEHEPGKYLYTVRARATDGNESQHPLFIQVLAETDEDGVITKPPFNIVDHFKDNYIYYIVFTVLAVGVVIVIRKKK